MIARPLEKARIDEMTEAVMKVARGDYSVQIGLSGENDEIDSLGMGINMMIDDIREHAAELKRAEEERRDAAARQERAAIVDAMPDPLLLLSLDKKIVYANPAHLRMFGHRSLGEIVGRGVGELEEWFRDPEEGAPRFSELCDRAIEKDFCEPVEIAFRTKDGRDVAASASGSLLRDAEGNPKNVVAILRDITERKQAEDALREREARYRTLVASLPAKVFLKDRNSVYISVNEIYAHDFARKPEDFVGKDDFAFFPPGLAEKYRADDHEVLASGKVRDFEEDYVAAGRQCWVHTIKAPVCDDSGNVVALLGLFWDITERKRTEEALRESERRLREAQSLGRIGSWQFDVKSGAIEWSDETYRLYERDPSLAPPTVEQEARYYTEEQGRFLREYARRAIEEARELEYDLRANLPSGRNAWFHARMTPVRDAEGRVAKLFGTVQDITERRQAEEQERQRFREMSQLSLSALQLVHSEPDCDIYQAIAEQLRRFTGDTLVVLTSFDPASGDRTIRAVEGLDSRLKSVLKTLGRSPIGMTFPHDPERTLHVGPRLQRIGSPAELSVGPLSAGALRTLERVLNLGSVHSMGMTYQGKESGVVSIITQRGKELSNPNAIETFINQAAIALQRRAAEEREKKRIEEVTVLSRTAMELVQLEPATDVYRHIARRLRELTGALLVGVCSFDAASDTFEVRALEGLGARLESAMGILGRHPVGTLLSLTPEQKTLYAAEKLTRIPGRLSELSLGKIPARVMRGFESLLNLGSVYAMAIYRQGVMLGTAAVIMRKGEELKNLTVVDTFINQAAVALQRKLAEDELARYRQHLEELVAERTEELKNAQEALVRQERLAAIGKVAGSMAHEIRNPLGAANNAVYFLNTTIADKLEGKPARHLDIIAREIARADAIITSVLDFTRGRETTPAPCRLSDILNQAIARAGLPKGVEIERQIPSGLPSLNVDPIQIGQVFLNLLTNAGQAMEGKGKITIEVPSPKSQVQSPKEAVRGKRIAVSVTDSGPGIKPEDLNRVFEPLFSTKTVGIGLGLSVCKAFVEANGGTIEVRSEPGKGATFTVALPFANQARQEAPVGSNREQNGETGTSPQAEVNND
jgi:PAS domain S-box-containing protein